jgi:Fe-S-cluster-containing hydrogenase component 2
MNKILVVDYEKCTGCRACEMACAVSHAGVSNPAKSAIRVVKRLRDGLNVPVICQQCEDPACANICSVQAISRDEETDAVVVDLERCVGCRMCMVACPFGAVAYNVDQRQAIQCDLCGGADPWCVRFCDSGALTFRPAAVVNLEKKREWGRHFRKALGADR